MIDLGEVTIGGQSAELWQRAMQEVGCMVGELAMIILREGVLFVPKRTTIRLVAVSNQELGAPEGAVWDRSYGLAVAKGLRKVSPEVAPAWRVVPAHLKRGEGLTIGMLPIEPATQIDLHIQAGSRMLTVESSNFHVPWLSTMPAYREGKVGVPWGPEKIWVFAR